MKEKMYFYKVMRPVLCSLFKLYYSPKFYGVENLNVEGPIIVAGNHVHLMDQFMPASNTKRCLHYMAKKEYFDNKKVSWFFKWAGCIPVNRKEKDSNAKEQAMKVLNDGLALGIFPEGTRNACKKEFIDKIYDICKNMYPKKEFYKKLSKEKTSQVMYFQELMEQGVITKEDFINNIYKVDLFLSNLVSDEVITYEDYFEHILLPLKFGAVSLSHKTNSYIIPFGITGDYKFRSKNLRVSFGKPFKVEGDLENANQSLRSTIINLMIENYRNNGK